MMKDRSNVTNVDGPLKYRKGLDTSEAYFHLESTRIHISVIENDTITRFIVWENVFIYLVDL